MDEEIKTWLYDILNSINEIESYFTGQTKRFDNFQKDLRTKRAVERNIEIIGEAVNRILKRNSQVHIPNARKIIDTRNFISHGYDKISDDVIWAIIIKHLPKLKTDVNALLM